MRDNVIIIKIREMHYNNWDNSYRVRLIFINNKLSISNHSRLNNNHYNNINNHYNNIKYKDWHNKY